MPLAPLLPLLLLWLVCSLLIARDALRLCRGAQEIDIVSEDLPAPFIVHVLYRARLPQSAAPASALESSGIHFVAPDKVLFPNRPARTCAPQLLTRCSILTVVGRAELS
jgi:hypothetical protein